MQEDKKRQYSLVLGLAIAIFLINIFVIYTYFYHDITGMPEAVNGRIDLSSVDLGKDKVYLDGQWEFYWDSFIVSDKSKTSVPALVLEVPGEWSKYKVGGKRLPEKGFASYKLAITGLSYQEPVTLFVPDFGGAYRIFIDGQLASQSGVVSKDTGGIFTVPKADLYPIALSSDPVHLVVIEVATTRFAGLYMTPILSDYRNTVAEDGARNTTRLILFGIAIFSFFSLMTMYTLSIRRKLYSLWLPIMIFFINLRIMLTTEFYSIWQPVVFFNLPYESTNELMYFTTFVVKYLLIFLIEEQCDIKFAKKEKIGFLIYYIFLYFIYLHSPQSFYNQYLSVIIPMLTYALDIYLFSKIYREREAIKKFGIQVFCGAILVISGLAIDSYYINGKIYMNMSLSLLFLFTVFALIMNWIYTIRSVDLYDDFIQSSSRLELANSQISMQKEYYDALSAQMNEIREIKHDIRHFIGVMSRLMEENKYHELESFLNQYKKKAQMEQLPVFCENIIANSIIGYYFLRAKENQTLFESCCNIGKQIIMSESDLCIVLGNALENAVIATKQIEDTDRRQISIEAGSIQNYMLIKVRNSYNGNLEVRDGHLVSLKGGKSHGLGLRNIEKVVESYGGYVKIEYDEKDFLLMVSVPHK